MSLLMLAVMVGGGSANALFGKIISIAVLMTILPYFYSALNLIDVATYPTKHFALTITSVIAMLFCFAAYAGAELHALIGVTIVSLAAFIFYVRKDRGKFEKSIYQNVHGWKIKNKE
jgi:cadaverine:lysine antiporter